MSATDHLASRTELEVWAEGSGISFVGAMSRDEAMVSEMPVVVSDFGALKEIVS